MFMSKALLAQRPRGPLARRGRGRVPARSSSTALSPGATLSSYGRFRLRDGLIGDVLVARAINVQKRANIGHASPGEAPKGFDYDLWVGPAPFVPFQSNRHHYTWHWWHDFGTGDMGNDGVHELDITRWGLGVEGHPSHVSVAGGKRT